MPCLAVCCLYFVSTSSYVVFSVYRLHIAHSCPFLSLLLGFAWPAYCTFRLLDDCARAGLLTENQKKEKMQRLLAYWIVITMFHMSEYVSDPLLGWLPFYFWSKLGILFWLQYADFSVSQNSQLVSTVQPDAIPITQCATLWGASHSLLSACVAISGSWHHLSSDHRPHSYQTPWHH